MNERKQIMNLLKPKKKAKEIRDRRTWWVLVAFLLAISALLFVLSGFEKVPAAEAAIEDDERPRCAIGNTVPDKHENHVEFAATWENGSATGAYPFEFGDGTSTVLTGTTGGIQFSHDYAYEVGGIVTYTAEFMVTNELTTTVCHVEQQIVIDDTPIIILPPPDTTQKVYLPQVFAQVAPPQAGIWTEVGPAWNHVVIHLVWTGGSDEWRDVYFGDGSSTKVFGAEGDTFVWHDYPYPGGAFTISYEVEGPGGKATSFYIVEVAP